MVYTPFAVASSKWLITLLVSLRNGKDARVSTAFASRRATNRPPPQLIKRPCIGVEQAALIRCLRIRLVQPHPIAIVGPCTLVRTGLVTEGIP